MITALQMERLLAPHGPYRRVLRPSRRQGARIHRLHPVRRLPGSEPGGPLLFPGLLHVRHQAGHAASGSLPLADITIYYMDIRAFGKGYEQFFQNAKAMGIEFVKGKVAR